MSRGVDTAGLIDGDLTQAQAAVASLAATYRLADSGAPADTAILPGEGDWWTAVDEAVARGATSVVVLQPDRRSSPLPALRPGVAVVLVERFAGNPALAAVRLPAALGAVFARVTAPRGRPDDLAFEALRTLGAAGVDRVRIERGVHSSSGLVLTGTAGGGPLCLVAAEGPEVELRIDLVGAGEHTELRLFDGALARPAAVTWTGPADSVTAPTVYETAFRCALRRAAAGRSDALDTFRRDAELIDAVDRDG